MNTVHILIIDNETTKKNDDSYCIACCPFYKNIYIFMVMIKQLHCMETFNNQ